MSFQVRERLSLADVVTLVNAGLGVAAMVLAVTEGPAMGARLILLAAVADGLDGILAREFTSTPVGLHLDSMADIVSFGTAPAVFVFAVVAEAWTPLTAHLGPYALAVVVPGLFAVLAIVRAAFYTVHFGEETTRPGVQNTLGASILAAGYLAIGGTLGLQATAWVVLAGATVLGLLMIAPVPYPKLVARDALAMGVVQMGAILLPGVGGRVFPRVLLVAALVYLVLAPRYYWA